MAIDVGDGAANYDNDSAGNTVVVLGNPANATGTINHVEIYYNRASDPGLKLGSFYLVVATDYKCRAGTPAFPAVAGAGLVTYNAPGDFAAFAITLGDFAGMYGGTVELATFGFLGRMYKGGDFCNTGDNVLGMSVAATQTVAIYFTGTETIAPTTGGKSSLMGTKLVAAGVI